MSSKLIFSRGFVNIFLIFIVIGIAILLSGSLLNKKNLTPVTGTLQSSNLCCDTGRGPDCKTVPGKTISFQGSEYGLLKSNVMLKETENNQKGDVLCHLKDSGIPDPNSGNEIILNNSDGFAKYWADQGGLPGHPQCGNGNFDQIWGPNGECVTIPRESIIYVCKQNCVQKKDYCWNDPSATSYGYDETVFDIYFKTTEAIPDIIKNCTVPPGTQAQTTPSLISGSNGKKDNLQLETFSFANVVPWFSPWCKPAVYLYPENTSFVSVRVNSSEPLTYSDPVYPSEGWGVTANPDGTIYYGIKPYDYLYYETKAADDKINVPTKGFVVEKNKLSELFSNILPRLGLNMRETEQFSDYWSNKLPDSPFYFVGIVPQTNLDSLTSLDIIPKPDSEIRVTLYFKPIEHKINVEPPTIVTPARTGFTVVEWGGIFKKDKDSNFSCFQ